MKDKEKDVGDRSQIREQREQAERKEPAKRSAEQRSNGEPHPAPTAGGVTRKQD